MTDSEKCYEAALKAQLQMNGSSCSSAISTLEEETSCGGNARYLITLASAYGCKAGYNTSTFFVSDLALFTSAGGIGGMSTFSTSASMDDPDNEAYADLWTAINILLYAGDIATTLEPTIARRAENFSSAELANIHSLLSYFLMVQIGKYIYYYGDSSATGVKGSGPQANTCLANYDDAAAVAFLGTGVTGGCVAGNTGHPDLGATGSLNVARMCEGVILMNNLLTALPAALDGFGGTEFSSINLTDLTDLTDDLRTALGAGNDDIVDVLNQANCVADNTTDDSIIQLYFAMVLEALFL